MSKSKFKKVPGKPKKSGSKYMGTEEDIPVSKENNLISWWAKLSAISNSAANLVTGVPQGDVLPESSQTAGQVGNVTRVNYINGRDYPGVVRINRVPIWGLTGGNNSGQSDISYLNRAASEFYWTVNHANSRDRSYDKSDLFSCLIQLDNILQMITQCVRVYGIAKKFSATNKYFGQALVEACGFDYSIVSGNNLAQFLYRLNVCIHQLNKFYIPNIVDMFAEHMNDISRIYCDAASSNPQLVVVNNAGYYEFDDATGAFTWHREMDMASFNLRNMSYFDKIDAQISAMYNSQYMGIMNADMRKCFGPSAAVNIPEIPVDYTTEFAYDKEFNLKLRNAQFMGSDYNISLGLNPTRVDELMATASILAVAKPSMAYDKVIYFNEDEPADVVNYLLATRFKFRYTLGSEPTGPRYLTDAGSELLVTMDMALFDPTTHNLGWMSDVGPTVYIGDDTEDAYRLYGKQLSYLLAYKDMLPIAIYAAFSPSNVTRNVQIFKLNDIQTIGILEQDEFARINYAAMASLYELSNITNYRVTSNGPSAI